MKVLVTGAGGFLGRYVVKAAVSSGHDVRALLRPASRHVPAAWQEHPQIEIVRGDLRSPKSIPPILEGVDGVIHLAAAKTGDLYEQFSGTVIATENLLDAMAQTPVDSLVVTSSFSVYEYLKRRQNSRIDETSPLAADRFVRDEYCQTKMEQERIVLEKAEEKNWRCVVLRPGVIYGRDNLWTARLGMQASDRWWIRIGASAALPLTYVENCAEAIVLAAEYEGHERRVVLNVVDNHLPTQKAYLDALQKEMTPCPRMVPIPWWFMRSMARLAWLTNRLFFKGTAKVPGLFVPSRLHARCKPMTYTNEKIVSLLGWTPRFSWQEGIKRSFGETDPADLPPAEPVESSPAALSARQAS